MAVIEASAAQNRTEPHRTAQSRTESRRTAQNRAAPLKPSRTAQALETPRVTQNLTESYKSHAGPSDCQ